MINAGNWSDSWYNIQFELKDIKIIREKNAKND